MSTEKDKEPTEEDVLNIFQDDSMLIITKEVYESLVTVIVGGALGHTIGREQVEYAMWLLERMNHVTRVFNPELSRPW